MKKLGLTHNDRYLEALSDDYFKIDERTLDDFVDFTLKFSKYVNFFNLENNIDGDGSVFFNNDVTILLIKISAIDLSEVEERFKQRILSSVHNIDPTLHFIYDIFIQIDSWNQKTMDETEFNTEIKKLIQNKFTKNLVKLQTYHEYYSSENICNSGLKTLYFTANPEWITEFQEYPELFEPDTTKADKIKNAKNMLYNIFNSTLASVKLIVESSLKYRQQYLEGGNTKPHVALFIAFIEMYKQAQYDINKFTNRHLEYYYNQILNIFQIGEIPDTAHITFELQDGADLIKLGKGTQLSGGQDEEGKSLIYELDEELIVSKAYISEKKAIINDENAVGKINKTLQNVFINLDLNKDVFSETKQPDSFEFGICLASSFLKLSEGERKITFTMEFQRYAFEKFMTNFENVALKNRKYNISSIDDFIENLFVISYSTTVNEQTEWFVIPEMNVSTTFQKNSDGNCINKLDITVLIDILYPPIDTCNDPQFPEALNKNIPICKFLINNSKAQYYNFYKFLIIEKINIATIVSGIKDLRIQNDFGPMDASMPFEPFGAVPTVGSTFYIGHDTIFSQHLDMLEVIFDWYDPPISANGFPEYYQHYNGYESNDIFKAKFSFLKDRKWYPSENHQIIDLFSDGQTDDEGNTPVNPATVINNIDLKPFNFHFKGAPVINTDDKYSRITKNGFLKFEFTFPPTGFGHKMYPEVVQKQATKGRASDMDIINPPWTPTLRSVSVNYSSEILIDIHNQNTKNKAYIYHLYPFGKKLVSEPVGRDIYIFPFYNQGSELILGLKNFSELEILTIYFHINEFSSELVDNKALVNWNFLNNDEWYPIKYDQILKDTTNDLTNSGIVMFDFPNLDPEFFNYKTFTNSTLLPSGYFWLKCNSINGEEFIRNIDFIKCHAASATFKSYGNSGIHLKNPLPANSISGFIEEVSDIRAVQQPYPSFNGKPVEDKRDFYVRVSERLAHKNRAINKWDYEHIILEEFNDIHKVLCINNINSNLEPSPGSVLIVILPKINQQESLTIQEPKNTSSRLIKIKESIQNRISPFVNIEVCNPNYEQVQIKFDVKFNNGLNERFYLQQVNQDIKQFLNPWQFGSEQQKSYGNKIYAMNVVYFLETRSYIDYVSNIALFHIINGNIVNLDNANNNNAVITTRTPVSIFVSAPEHIITVVGGDERQEAIGSMIIGKDFSAEDIAEIIIGEGIDKDQIEIDLRVHFEKIEDNAKDKYVFTFNSLF